MCTLMVDNAGRFYNVVTLPLYDEPLLLLWWQPLDYTRELLHRVRCELRRVILDDQHLEMRVGCSLIIGCEYRGGFAKKRIHLASLLDIERESISTGKEALARR